MKDGIVLLKVFDVIQKGSVDWKKVIPQLLVTSNALGLGQYDTKQPIQKA